jgi:transposase-like protein
MDFPLLDICDDALGESWLAQHFHPEGVHCPSCGSSVKHARFFGHTQRNHVTRYRCRRCERVYTVYTATIFANKQLRPAQVILFLRGVCKGESTASLARELHLAYDTLHHLRQQLHATALELQPNTPLPDDVTETDELFQNAGEKRRKTQRPRRSTAPSSQQAERAWHVRK